MRKVTISIQVDAEKLRAIQFYVRKKDSTLESELEDCITKIYEKYEASVECVGRKIRYGQHLPERGASPS